MGVGEERTTLGQGIDVGGFGLWVPAQGTHPVIEIIHHNEEHIGANNRLGCHVEAYQTACQDQHQMGWHGKLVIWG
jgi:hypothetical protein